MADTKPQVKEEDKKNTGIQEKGLNVATLSIPTIMSALHQKALAEADKVAAGKVRIVNSAIDDEGKGKKELKSAGEHIISVIPTTKEEPVEKTFAITVIKTYVQWFIGPDLASKVNDKTVKSLTEAPANESIESNHFMSFSKFLLEETAPDEDDSEDAPDEDDADNAEENDSEDAPDEDDADNAEENEDGENPPEAGEGEENQPKEDESKQSKTGYYISYNLIVEGLKQTALKDAMKKFAKTFFDDLTITGSGLFGGGGNSFTVKDIKQKFRDVFGPIDPGELVDNVEKELKTKYPKSDPIYVEVQDKDTLLSDIGKQADAKQKKMINGSKYSLFIKVTEHDPKKPLLNPRLIADIVTSSIKGLFKKFKNAITKDDVVYIPNYVDTHEDTAKLKRLYKEVPTLDQLKGKIGKKSTLAVVWKDYETTFDKISKNPLYEKCRRAMECVKVWEEFKKNDKVKKRKEQIDKTNVSGDVNGIKDFFKDFYEKYQEKFDGTSEEQFNESISQFISLNKLKTLLIENIFNKNDNMNICNTILNKTNEQSIKKSILDILFEEEKEDKNSNINQSNKEDSTEEDSAEEDNSIEDKKSTEQSSNEESNEELNDVKFNNTSFDVDDSKGKEDLYIIPIPNMNYKDKEYDTYA